jgi:hypothetical protein
MKLAWRVVAIVGIAAALASLGCGKEQRPSVPTTVAKADVPLPEWAPNNPSPEFMRAARVLKPMPMEFAEERTQGDLARKALAARYHSTLPGSSSAH